MKNKVGKNTGSINLQTMVYHDPKLVTAPMDDELVMFSLERGMYYGLDDIASKIWQRIDRPISVADLCYGLMEDYEVDRETCQRETLELLSWLYRQDLIKIDPGSPA